MKAVVGTGSAHPAEGDCEPEACPALRLTRIHLLSSPILWRDGSGGGASPSYSLGLVLVVAGELVAMAASPTDRTTSGETGCHVVLEQREQSQECANMTKTLLTKSFSP